MQIGSVGGSYGYGNTMGGLLGCSGMSGQHGPPPMAKLANKKLSDIDGNGDGSISESELQQALAGTTSTDGTSTTSSVSSDAADKLFKKIDTNGDGKISSDEWTTFQQNLATHRHHHHHSQASGAGDNSQDSTQSLQNAVAQLYKSADTDGNGQLSQSELINALS